MTYDGWRDERMLEWLESGPSDVPVEPLEAAVAYARAHPRSRLASTGLGRFLMSRIPLTQVQPPAPHRRWNTALGAAVAVVVVSVVAVGGLALIARNTSNEPGGAVAPVVTPTAVPSPVPTPVPPSAVPTATSVASACTVATLAGKAGETGSTDGVGAGARFGEEGVGLVMGPGGLIYMPDRDNHVIRTMTADGVVTTIAGEAGDARSVDGVGPAARFRRPSGGAFDAAGNFYTADTDANTIRRMAPDGTVTTIAGKALEAGTTDGVGSAARFMGPIVGAVDASGNVYVGSTTENAIRKVAPDGTVTTIAGKALEVGWSDGVGSAARFHNPWFVALDAQRDLWVVDANSDGSYVALRKVTPDGTVTTIKSEWTYGAPFGLWIDPSGAVYYTAYLSNTVAMLTPDGEEVLLAGKPGPAGEVDGPGDAARFGTPTGITRDGSGTLYVSDAAGTIRTIRCP